MAGVNPWKLTADAADTLVLDARRREIEQARSRFPLGSIIRNRPGFGRGRGVVVKHYAQGDRQQHICAVVGDMVIGVGTCQTVSNRYDEWEVVPDDERTRGERVLAVLYTPEVPTEPDDPSEDETTAWHLVYELALMLGVDPIDDLQWPGTIFELGRAIAAEFDGQDRRAR